MIDFDTVGPTDAPLKDRTMRHARTEILLRDALLTCAEREAGHTDDGDARAAFAEIYALTARPFAAVVRRILRDEALTADVLQQGYVAIWQKADRFDPNRGKAFSWMLVVMRNKALDALRARDRRPGRIAFTDSLAETVADTGSAPDAEHHDRVLAARLAPYLNGLRPDVAGAIRAYVMAGRPAVDIARDLGRSENTVKSWIRRGLAQIRRDIHPDRLEDWI